MPTTRQVDVETHPFIFLGNLVEDRQFGCHAQWSFTFGRITDFGAGPMCNRQVSEEGGVVQWLSACPGDIEVEGQVVTIQVAHMLRVARDPIVGRDGVSLLYPAAFTMAAANLDMSCTYQGFVALRERP